MPLEEKRKRAPKPPETCKGPSKPHHAQFKPGQSGNPGGNRRLPADVIKMKELSRQEFAKAINKFFYLTRNELDEKLKEPELTMIDIMVGSMVARASKEQDVVRAQFLLDRAIGKVQESISIKHEFENVPNEKLIVMAQEAIQILQEAEKEKPQLLEAEYFDESSKNTSFS